MEEPNKLRIDPAAIVNLKADLVRKQEEFRLKRLGQRVGADADRNAGDEYESNKRSSSIWGRKKASSMQAQSEATMRERIHGAPAPVKEEAEEESESATLERSRRKLEAKARFYEEMALGKQQPDEGDDEIFLVDFDRKRDHVRDDNDDDSQEAATEAKKGFALKQHLDEDEYNERMRDKWRYQEAENRDKDSVHYGDVRFDEIRNLGVGSFKLSVDQSERSEQLDFFKKLHSQTQVNRIANEIAKLKRQRLLVERLNKVHSKRMLKEGYSLEEIQKTNRFEKDLEEIDEEIGRLERVRAQGPTEAATVAETEEDEGQTSKFEQVRKSKPLTREWDKPKLKEKMWEKQIKKIRSERNKQFAPPSSYK